MALSCPVRRERRSRSATRDITKPSRCAGRNLISGASPSEKPLPPRFWLGLASHGLIQPLCNDRRDVDLLPVSPNHLLDRRELQGRVLLFGVMRCARFLGLL